MPNNDLTYTRQRDHAARYAHQGVAGSPDYERARNQYESKSETSQTGAEREEEKEKEKDEREYDMHYARAYSDRSRYAYDGYGTGEYMRGGHGWDEGDCGGLFCGGRREGGERRERERERPLWSDDLEREIRRQEEREKQVRRENREQDIRRERQREAERDEEVRREMRRQDQEQEVRQQDREEEARRQKHREIERQIERALNFDAHVMREAHRRKADDDLKDLLKSGYDPDTLADTANNDIHTCKGTVRFWQCCRCLGDLAQVSGDFDVCIKCDHHTCRQCATRSKETEILFVFDKKGKLL